MCFSQKNVYFLTASLSYYFYFYFYFMLPDILHSPFLSYYTYQVVSKRSETSLLAHQQMCYGDVCAVGLSSNQNKTVYIVAS